MPWTRKRAPASLAASSSKTRMNSAPIILRLASGSVTPASRSRKRASASTATSGTLKVSRNAAITCSPSPLRIRPWSTNTQVSWSPIARCTSSAATDESTPPESPQIDPAVADLRADPRDLLVDDRRRGSSCGRRRRCPRGTSSGSAGRTGCGRPRGGTGSRRCRAPGPRRRRPARPSRTASSVNPGGRAPDAVAVRHPAGLLARQPGEQPAGLANGQLGAAELADLGALDERRRARARAAACRSRCRAPGCRARAAPWSSCGRAVGVHRRRPAGEDQPLRRAPRDLLGARRRPAAAPRRRRTRGRGARSAASTGRRSR